MDKLEELKKEVKGVGRQAGSAHKREEAKELVEGLMEKAMSFTLGECSTLYLPKFDKGKIIIYDLKEKKSEEVTIERFEWKAGVHANHFFFFAGSNCLSSLSP